MYILWAGEKKAVSRSLVHSGPVPHGGILELFKGGKPKCTRFSGLTGPPQVSSDSNASLPDHVEVSVILQRSPDHCNHHNTKKKKKKETDNLS